MIKFFRNIRKQLLGEGKTGKYFKYAIGEIVLVVIGILIALWINNLNIDSQEQKETFALVNSLELELNENLREVDDRKKELTKIVKNFIKVLNFSANSNSDLPIDTLKVYVTDLMTFAAIEINDSRFNSAKSAGKFNLLSEEMAASLAVYENTISNFRKFSDKTTIFDDQWFELGFKHNIVSDFHAFFYKDINLQKHQLIEQTEDSYRKFITDIKTYKTLYRFYTQNLVELAWLESLSYRMQSTLTIIEAYKENYD
jgi:hypothetical protein